MDSKHFKISNGVLAQCLMSGKEDVTVTIPDGVTSIGLLAFSRCKSLESITIPDSVINIGYFVFEGYRSLQSIDVSEDNSNYFSCGGVLFDNFQSILIKYPSGKKDLSFTIPDSVASMRLEAFWGCELLSITIPDSVTHIGVGAFYGCDNLTICAPDGSYAIKYAKNNDIKFKEI